MPLADDLEEEVRSLPAKGKITDLVTDEEVRRLIGVEFFDEGLIGLGGDELIDHVDGGGEEDLDIGVTSSIGDALGEEGFSGAGVADQEDIHVVADEVEIEEVEDRGLLLLAGVVMVEVELIDRDLLMEFGLLKAQPDGILAAILRLDLGKLS